MSLDTVIAVLAILAVVAVLLGFRVWAEARATDDLRRAYQSKVFGKRRPTQPHNGEQGS